MGFPCSRAGRGIHVVAPRAYWSENRDPFGHRDVDPRSFDEAWSKALRTQRTPDFLCMMQELGEIEGLRVLELGSGYGHETLRAGLEGAHAIGLDIDETRCRTAREMCRKFHPRAPVSFHAGDASAIPVGSGTVDRVFARDVLMYSDPGRVLAESARVLRPGGRAVFDEALAGNPFVALYRRWLAPRGHREIVHYLDADQMRSLGAPGLRAGEPRFFYYFSTFAFFGLYILRSEWLFRLALGLLQPVDRLVDRCLPGMRRFAWRGVVSFRKE